MCITHKAGIVYAVEGSVNHADSLYSILNVVVLYIVKAGTNTWAYLLFLR